MIRNINKSFAYLLIVFLSLGCQALTGKTAGQNVDDATITASVKAKLVEEKASNLTRVDVDTNNAVVQLSGVVETTADKARAEQLARQVKEARKVVNNLQVQPKK
ncbi:MAG TPA: BON domain-containing protein [Gammaproteobacteria bacterium]|nr:BON domain-containing protein [Gammaproteobacteria bacterium]